MDSFNRDVVYCYNDFGDIATGVSCSSNDGITIKDRIKDYVRKDELEDLVNKLFNIRADKDDADDTFRKLSYRLNKGNKKKNGISFLNYEKEIRGYELLQKVGVKEPTKN